MSSLAFIIAFLSSAGDSSFTFWEFWDIIGSLATDPALSAAAIVRPVSECRLRRADRSLFSNPVFPKIFFCLLLSCSSLLLLSFLVVCTICPSDFRTAISPTLSLSKSFKIRALSLLLLAKKRVGLFLISLITLKTSASLLNISGCFTARLFKFAAHSSVRIPLKSLIHCSGLNVCCAY